MSKEVLANRDIPYVIAGTGSLTITNSGKIKGSFKNNVPAIHLFGGGDDILRIKTGSSIVGDIILDGPTKVHVDKDIIYSSSLVFKGKGNITIVGLKDLLSTLDSPVFYDEKNRKFINLDPTIFLLRVIFLHLFPVLFHL
ncbi:MAG: hypothetical protein PSN37_03145 [Alphaproteobacteria bacterium]|nr:hypothetical protein [Alphaproteobacteria bacterium]